MALFAILAPSDAPGLVQVLEARFKDNYLKVGPGQWILSGSGTASDISKLIGISDGQVGTSAIVLLIGGYFGRASTDIWEWMASKGSAGVPRV